MRTKNVQRDTWTSTNILQLVDETDLQHDRNEIIMQYSTDAGNLRDFQ